VQDVLDYLKEEGLVGLWEKQVQEI
jgi:hypothetical protein